MTDQNVVPQPVAVPNVPYLRELIIQLSKRVDELESKVKDHDKMIKDRKNA
jgi:hypothetical protein